MSLEKYSVEKLIGKGSYGEVFLAKHKKDKRMYVVKKVSLHKASEKERKAAEQEAKLLSQLRHPNIVSYRESFQGEQGFLFIIMNYCEGGDLYSKLKAQKSTLLDEKQIVEWFVQIAMALQYMHEKHILHRDLKTQNIFLTRSKIIKLGDLGIAKVLENSSDMATTLIGTPYYMSPELFSNRPYNHKSDVWALGCCLYEMCTLRHAFNAKDMSSLVYKILKGKIPPLPKQYSADLCSIIKNMLDQDPDKRPSVSRLLRHPYIKKQIAAFLEGTKNRFNYFFLLQLFLSFCGFSSQSVSDSNKLTARERRRLKQSLSGSPIHRSSDPYNTPPLPSPLEIRNRKSQERSSKETPRSSVTPSTPQDSVDGPPRKVEQQIESESSEDDSNGSDLEEISMDEPVKPSRRQNSEVSSLISALDSTLKLDDKSADRVSPEIEDNDQDNDEVLRPTGASPNSSGRFHDRLERLKIDCLNDIGEEMLHRACNIINSVSDDEVEDELVKYMGRDHFDKYGGLIWQLNVYDHFQKS
ncbi:serine/threonine-protein kinase Nek4-like [Actinia tenebrosa]|uniref:non-specific serine/threonine protein kinase n=1 Tax=Actinia tenebrosa TaxID=6105 RepID=A0A6P8H9E0_ACTTE|nr:serine/threonine-protein kinase Nek4-like [Actinia tenebrosa]